MARAENTQKIVVRKGSVIDYIYRVVELVNKGHSTLTLYAMGDNICKMVDVVSMLPSYLPGAVRITGWKIGSRKVMGERKSFLEITLSYSPPNL